MEGMSLKNKIYHLLFNDILLGKYVPETPLTEKELTEKYNVSKSPIREALIELCNEGVLRSIPRYGYEVLRIQEKQVKEAKDARILIECASLYRYFEMISNDEIKALYEILDSDVVESSDILTHWDKNTRFHISLMKCYGNSFLVSEVQDAMTLMKRAYGQYQYNKWKKVEFKGGARAHHDLLETIAKGDRNGAVEILRSDIDSFDTSFLA